MSEKSQRTDVKVFSLLKMLKAGTTIFKKRTYRNYRRFKWIETADKLKIKTEFEKQLERIEFKFEQSASYIDLDRLLISGYARPILNELRLSYSDKLRVLDIVKIFRKKSF